LLFSNPDSVRGRHHITIKASPDRGMTWPKENRLLLDEGSGRGYSCLSMIDRHTVGILYEGSQAQLTFQRIPLRNLVDGGASEQTRPSPRAMHLALPRVFGDHMVLQADAEIPVWGQAKAQAKVTIQLGGEKHEVKADRSGQWQVRLRARPASATQTELRVESGGEQVCFTNVVIGEVWICAGQSNMAWPLNLSANGTAELSAADHPSLRLLHLAGRVDGSSGVYTPQHLASLTPDKFCVGEWKVASTESAGEFSAVAWYFGRHLQHELRVPVGLICPAVGGTPTEAWIPREALERDPQLKGLVAGNWLDNPRLSEFCRTRGQQNLLPAIQAGESLPGDDLGPNHSFKPGFMWSAGIQPLLPYAIRGVVWYQGESNAENPTRVLEHRQLFPLLVGEWRKRWGQGDFPFLFVQLPGVDRPDWPLFREGQRRMLDQLNNVGMAISIDTGHPTNVHPVAKKPVGERLSKWALGTTYRSNSHTCYSGPLLDVVEREGDSIVAYFKQVGVGLKSTDESLLRHFEICGGDGVFHPATAKIIGKSSVSVSSPHVAEPQHVRYVWQPFPDPPVNLINSEGLPASPFSTRDECERRVPRSAK
jgi:sialate O-acetylesterase